MQGQFITANIVVLYGDIKQVMKIREGGLECWGTKNTLGFFSSLKRDMVNMKWKLVVSRSTGLEESWVGTIEKGKQASSMFAKLLALNLAQNNLSMGFLLQSSFVELII